jgi:hypothetical protein
MSRQRYVLTRARAGVGLLLLAFASSVSACDEDGKTVPERCADPALPIFDIQAAGTPADDNAQYPCSTPVGHAVSSVGQPATAGTTNGGTSGGGASGGGEGGGTATAGAGAGGAP